ncbi:MAG: ABC transporter ATP-binding protein [Candidatus Hydrogenedentes bacterium]|nr:ABC transporter ATP-binding protein [Candidatus Hydrogenedentota bacterium]
MSPVVEVRDIFKSFDKTVALRNVSFSVGSGEICGLIGPNGAGKTTLIRILATLMRPDMGRANVFGFNVNGEENRVRPLIGYMPDSGGAYRDMLLHEYLEFFAAAYGIEEPDRTRVVKDCLELTGLHSLRERQIDGLSRGMRQRLGLARCLVHDPKLLILDEPASGLDPRARIELLAVLNVLREMGKTILISSHILSELSSVCTRMCILDNGSVLYNGSIKEALTFARSGRRIRVKTIGDTQRAAELLASYPAVKRVDTVDNTITIDLPEDMDDFSFIAARLVKEGLKVLTIEEEEALLEDVFLKMTDPDRNTDSGDSPNSAPQET